MSGTSSVPSPEPAAAEPEMKLKVLPLGSFSQVGKTRLPL